MALRLACDTPELFAAVGVFLASMPDYAGQDCHPTKPIAFMMVNGTADPIMPYDGGSTAAGLKVWGTERTFWPPPQAQRLHHGTEAFRGAAIGLWRSTADRSRSLGGMFGRADRSLQCSWWWPSSAGRARQRAAILGTAQTLWDFFHGKTMAAAANN